MVARAVIFLTGGIVNLIPPGEVEFVHFPNLAMLQDARYKVKSSLFAQHTDNTNPDGESNLSLPRFSVGNIRDLEGGNIAARD
jgi:hypothetical protein